MKKKKINRKVLKMVTMILIVIFTSIGTVFAERIIASNKVTYNNGTSKLSSTNVQGAVDELYKKCVSVGSTFNFAKFLQAMEPSDTVITDDGTADHNMRYTGKEPNNYVTFEGELWRVIGVFNNIDNGTGEKETRVKIIKSDSIGNKQWHSSNVNIWKSAQLNRELQALSYASNSMLENAVWYLGDPGSDYDYTATQAYTYERGTKVASGNDATWTGKVGLIYPSDYGFASSACKYGEKTLAQYSATDIDCKGTNWLFLGFDEWLLSPHSGGTSVTRYVSGPGWVAHINTSISCAIRPVVYLKSSVVCKNCSASNAGIKENPFKLGI